MDIEILMKELSLRRKVYVSEADFQLEMAMLLRETYPEAKVRLEYTPSFEPNMHIDILMILDGKWYPIELKYKTKGCHKIVDGDEYNLKDQRAQDIGRCLYLEDVQRIERIRKNVPEFAEGYTVFLTNDMTYLKKPREGVIYEDYALADGLIKKGELKWSEQAGKGSTKGHEAPIILEGKYLVEWKEYSRIDDSDTGTFKYLANKVTVW